MRLPGKGMSWKEMFKALGAKYSADNVGDVAGNLTFSGILALFPFLLFLVALAGAVIGPQQLEGIVGRVSSVAPPAAAKIVADQLRAIVTGGSAGLLTVGALGALLSASGGMGALQRALNTVYDVKEGRPFWKARGVALLMTIVCAALALSAAVLAVAIQPVAASIGGPLAVVVRILAWPAAGFLMMLVWALLYWGLPDVEQEFKFITPGSIVGVLLWVAASVGFRFYVSNFGSYNATYGALGGVIVLLMWMWISSQIVLVGAEINAVIEHKSPEGKRPGAKKMEDKGTEPTREGAEMARAKQAAKPHQKAPTQPELEPTHPREPPREHLDDGAVRRAAPERPRRRDGKLADLAVLAGLVLLRPRKKKAQPRGRAF